MTKNEEELFYFDMGRKLKLARKQSKFTQGSLASTLGVSRTSVTNIEAGNQKIPLHLLYDLGAIYNIDPREFLPHPATVQIDSDVSIVKAGNKVVDLGEKSASLINELMNNK